MKKYCPLCGSALENGICPNHHETKAMCLNCTFCREQEDGEVVCDNSDNLKDAREKLLASFASQQANGYAIKKLDVEIEPLPLKKPPLPKKPPLLKKLHQWRPQRLRLLLPPTHLTLGTLTPTKLCQYSRILASLCLFP